jgi:hypothetical protein
MPDSKRSLVPGVRRARETVEHLLLNNDPELPKPWSESLDPTFSMLMGAKWSRDLLEPGHCLPINPVLGARIKIVLGKYQNGDVKNKDLIESIIWSAKQGNHTACHQAPSRCCALSHL